MGLDMYLYGRKYIASDWKNPENILKEDGFRVVEKRLDVGYWRKHPNLHGFIVQEFADNVDECQEIELSVDDIHKIIDAVVHRKLPDTEGFFFGDSAADGEAIENDLEILKSALEWVTAEGNTGFRSLVYQASW
jgi:hypothetical protein